MIGISKNLPSKINPKNIFFHLTLSLVEGNKERQNLPAVIFILLFLTFILPHLTGKIDAESGKV
jgi:hypothetical protein